MIGRMNDCTGSAHSFTRAGRNVVISHKKSKFINWKSNINWNLIGPKGWMEGCPKGWRDGGRER